MGPVVEAVGLVKDYGRRRAVDRLDLSVPPGQFCAVLGPNGAGKSTFLRMVTGAVLPSAGRLTVLGYPVPAAARAMRRLLGVVPQEDSLDPDFTVAENLRTFADYHGLAGPELDARITGLLEFSGLGRRLDTHVTQLSGGMRRRLSLVRALLNSPRLLVLDEPTTGLDPQARQQMWQLLRRLREEGRTVLLTTHYMEEAERLCDRVVIIDRGRVLADDSPRGLIARHIEAHVVEVHGPGLAAWEEATTALAERRERVGETEYLYTADPAPLVAAARGRPGLHLVQRPGNLEDVFLRLTGRDLRE